MASDAAFSYATPASCETALACLSGPVRAWFTSTYGVPTTAQRAAWPAVRDGQHLLLVAPTGTGKTLAAFAPIISALFNEPAPGVRCLYVAPLKALARDAAKNLCRHLREIRRLHRHAPLDPSFLPRIHLGLRTGDTPPARRRRQLLDPPHILLTTPESLAILLSRAAGRALFGNLRWVIVDEAHALAPTKRGIDLALSLERLEASAARERDATPQRIGLSATCAPLEEAARFLAGSERMVTIARADQPSPLELIIEPLPVGDDNRPGFLARLLERLRPVLKRNRTTLIFTNIRSIAERVCWCLRRRYPAQAPLFAVHHSSLAPERRRRVERRLKEGKLRCVVSSTSLELGVDIGSVDQVVFIHPPGGATRLLQRIGRSGHRPGQPRRGLVLTAGAADLLESIVTGASSRAGQIETLRVPPQPLDVLCQHLVGMASEEEWTVAEALALFRRCYAYRGLDGETLERCLDYLCGLDRQGRPWLLPRLRWVAQDEANVVAETGGRRFTIVSERMARLMRRNLGTILNEDPREVRLLQDASPNPDNLDDVAPRATPVGALDEGYADRLQPGDRFVLDGRCFEYAQDAPDALLVREVFGSPFVPHWSGRGWSIAAELAERIYLFRLQVAEALRDGKETARAFLGEEMHLSGPACAEVIRLFLQQEALSQVPDIHTLLIEAIATDGGVDYYLHTPLNRPGNDAILRLVLLRLERDWGLKGNGAVADLGLLLSLPLERVLEPGAWRTLLAAGGFRADFERCLDNSPAFRERFARVATTGLMVLRSPWTRKRKVGGQGWVSRRLFDLVRQADPEFVLLRQAEEEMRSKVCDAPAALRYLERLPRLAIQLRWLEEPSPFAASWTQPAEVEPAPDTLHRAGEPRGRKPALT